VGIERGKKSRWENHSYCKLQAERK
jgi:hypothetical protein